MKEICAICGCPLHRGNDYAKPTVEGRAHATKHHYVPERFFGRSGNRPGTQRNSIFEKCPWDSEGETVLFCYECHEELMHNPVFLPKDIERFAELVRRKNLDEDSKPSDRHKIAGRVQLLHKLIDRGLMSMSGDDFGGSKQLREITSWRLVSEIMRRYPGKFRLIETHPGSGMYDCLTLIDDQGNHADFNREGSFHFFGGENYVQFDVWCSMVNDGAMKEVLDRISEVLGLPIPEKLPASTAEVLSYRFIATFLSHALFSQDYWECRNGYYDTSGIAPSEVNLSAFEAFPEARERLRTLLPDDFQKQPAYRFWFIKKNNKPEICVETTGTVWLPGKTFNLMDLYQKDRRIWPLVFSVAGQFFY